MRIREWILVACLGMCTAWILLALPAVTADEKVRVDANQTVDKVMPENCDIPLPPGPAYVLEIRNGKLHTVVMMSEDDFKEKYPKSWKSNKHLRDQQQKPEKETP